MSDKRSLPPGWARYRTPTLGTLYEHADSSITVSRDKDTKEWGAFCRGSRVSCGSQFAFQAIEAANRYIALAKQWKPLVDRYQPEVKP